MKCLLYWGKSRSMSWSAISNIFRLVLPKAYSMATTRPIPDNSTRMAVSSATPLAVRPLVSAMMQPAALSPAMMRRTLPIIAAMVMTSLTGSPATMTPAPVLATAMTPTVTASASEQASPSILTRIPITATAGPTPTRSYTYDANGSPTTDSINQYGYDSRGRMTQATTATGVYTYGINALGQRVQKIKSATGTLYHYDTQGHLIAETDTTGP